MKMLVAVLALLLSGCVSAGYHQRAVREAKVEELTRARDMARDVKLQNMSIYEYDDRLKALAAELRRGE